MVPIYPDWVVRGGNCFVKQIYVTQYGLVVLVVVVCNVIVFFM